MNMKVYAEYIKQAINFASVGCPFVRKLIKAYLNQTLDFHLQVPLIINYYVV